MMQQPQQQQYFASRQPQPTTTGADFIISNRYNVLAAKTDKPKQKKGAKVVTDGATTTGKPKPKQKKGAKVVTDGATTTTGKPKPKPKQKKGAKVVTDGTTTTAGCGVNCVYCKYSSRYRTVNKKTTVGGGDPRFPKELAKQGSHSNWERMLKCFLPLSNGTLPAVHLDYTTRPALNLSKEAQEWLMEAKQSQTVYVADVFEHVDAIASFFTIPEDELEEVGVTEAEFEEMLEKLQGYVESVDVINELYYSTSHLVPFLNGLHNPHASVRAKVAELITTMVQNNPSSQQIVMEVNGLPPLLYNFTSDPDATSRTKALGAISALIRNNKPGITAFRLANGYAALKDALSSESVRIQRDALHLIQYLLHENSSDCNIVTELGLPGTMMELASSDDAEVREATLRVFVELARDEEGGNSGQLVKTEEKLKRVLQERIEGINAMAPEDLGAAREERLLVGSLWNAFVYPCFLVRMQLRRLMFPPRFFSSVILILGTFISYFVCKFYNQSIREVET